MMGKRQTDGSILLLSGKVVYSNSAVEAGDLRELMDILGESPATAAAREIRRTSTEAFMKEVTKELYRLVADVGKNREAAETEIVGREAVLLESRFRTLDNRILNFSLQKGRGYAEMSIGEAKGGGLTIGMSAVLDRHEVDRARSLLGIKKRSPADYWLQSCVEGMKELGRLERRMGTVKLHMRPNQGKGWKRKFGIGKTTANYPKGRKG